MLAPSQLRPPRANRVAALLISTALGSIPLALAGEPAGRTDIILSGLPPSGSESYRSIERAAAGATIQPLEMTKSEKWSVPSDRLPLVEAEAARFHVTIMRLEPSHNKILAPMAHGTNLSSEQTAMMEDTMSSPATMSMTMMALPDTRQMEWALTAGMQAEAPDTPPAQLVIPLNGGLSVTAEHTRIEMQGDAYVWHGAIVGTGDAVSLLWWPSGRITGQIAYQGRIYAVKPMGEGMAGVVEMSPSRMPPEHAPMGGPLMQKMNMSIDPLVTMGDASMLRKDDDARENGGDEPSRRDLEDAPIEGRAAPASPREPVTAPPHTDGHEPDAAPIEISVLVAYTAKAAGRYTDVGKDLVRLAVEQANQSFRASGIGHVRLKLAHDYQTDYVENGSHFEHVFRFADKGDGYMEEVHALRDAHKADVAVLIVDDPNGCGLAAGVAPRPNRSFAVVHQGCAAATYSFAHEIGHLLGARHDLALDSSTVPFPFGHGFVMGTQWRTMMSYQESCGGCVRLPIWSNPNVTVQGFAAGDAHSDNARVIAARAATVASFR